MIAGISYQANDNRGFGSGFALFNADGTYKNADALRGLYETAGIDLKKPVATSCGSGITASVLAFGLHLIGHRDVAVYDGSWAEWGLPGDTPVET